MAIGRNDQKCFSIRIAKQEILCIGWMMIFSLDWNQPFSGAL